MCSAVFRKWAVHNRDSVLICPVMSSGVVLHRNLVHVALCLRVPRAPAVWLCSTNMDICPCFSVLPKLGQMTICKVYSLHHPFFSQNRWDTFPRSCGGKLVETWPRKEPLSAAFPSKHQQRGFSKIHGPGAILETKGLEVGEHATAIFVDAHVTHNQIISSICCPMCDSRKLLYYLHYVLSSCIL